MAQYDKVHNKVRTQSMQIAGLENDVKAATKSFGSKLDTGVEDAVRLADEVRTLTEELAEWKNKAQVPSPPFVQQAFLCAPVHSASQETTRH